MPKTQLDNIANGIAIDIANDILPVWLRRYTLFVLTNQNHYYMPKLNYVNFFCLLNSVFHVLKGRGRRASNKRRSQFEQVEVASSTSGRLLK